MATAVKLLENLKNGFEEDLRAAKRAWSSYCLRDLREIHINTMVEYYGAKARIYDRAYHLSDGDVRFIRKSLRAQIMQDQLLSQIKR